MVFPRSRDTIVHLNSERGKGSWLDAKADGILTWFHDGDDLGSTMSEAVSER